MAKKTKKKALIGTRRNIWVALTALLFLVSFQMTTTNTYPLLISNQTDNLLQQITVEKRGYPFAYRQWLKTRTVNQTKYNYSYEVSGLSWPYLLLNLFFWSAVVAFGLKIFGWLRRR